MQKIIQTFKNTTIIHTNIHNTYIKNIFRNIQKKNYTCIKGRWKFHVVNIIAHALFLNEHKIKNRKYYFDLFLKINAHFHHYKQLIYDYVKS